MASLNTIFDQQVSIKLLRKRLNVEEASEDELIAVLMATSFVDLSNSGLTGICGLDVCSDLVSVDLSCNELSTLDYSTLEMLIGLRYLNLEQNLLTELQDLSMLTIYELNIAFNPLTIVTPAFLPQKLERMSISGTQIEHSSIISILPDIVFFDTQERTFQFSNEIEDALRAVDEEKITEDEIINEHRKNAISGKEKEIPLVSASQRISKIVKPQFQSKIVPNGESFEPPQQLPELASLEKEMYTNEMENIAGKYADALAMVDVVDVEEYTQEINEMILDSENRAAKDFEELKSRLTVDEEAIDARKDQADRLLNQKISEIKNISISDKKTQQEE